MKKNRLLATDPIVKWTIVYYLLFTIMHYSVSKLCTILGFQFPLFSVKDKDIYSSVVSFIGFSWSRGLLINSFLIMLSSYIYLQTTRTSFFYCMEEEKNCTSKTINRKEEEK